MLGVNEEEGLMSKSQKKKRLREEKYLVKKAYQKKLKKEKKKIRQAQKISCEKNVQKTMGNETGVMMEKKKCDRIKNQQEFLKKCEENPCIVIDCDFDGYHSLKDMTSLTQQLMYTYGMNRQCENPFNLKFVGLSDTILGMLQRISGVDHWLCDVSKKALENCFDLDNLNETERHKFVYLTADAPTPLNLLNKNDIYIIGGIVDRNKEKGLTLKKAEHLGLRTARLPLTDYCHLLGSKVLTVNQVFQLLQVFYCTRNWKEAIQKSVPVRKMT